LIQGKVFSSSVAVIQARQCLTEKFILFQSASAEASSELTDPSSKVCCSDHVSKEQSTLWSSFDSMITADEETDVELMQSLSSAEVKIESYLQEPNQPRKCNPAGKTDSLPYFNKNGCCPYLLRQLPQRGSLVLLDI